MKHIFKCLLIDDDPEEHELFAMALEEISCANTCVYFVKHVDAVAYLASLNNHATDFYFVDWSQSLREHHLFFDYFQGLSAKLHSKCFIYSGSKHQQMQDHYLMPNVGFLEKQSSISELSRILDELIK